MELSAIPFIPPSVSNFLFDPFAIDLDNPFQGTTEEEQELTKGLDISGTLIDKSGTGLNFENVMKCIKNLSISSLFESGNSKKFTFNSMAEDIRNKGGSQVPSFPGQSHSNQELRQRVIHAFAKAEILERKNELGLILDLIASCLDMDPKKRPTIMGLLNSPLF